MKWVITLHGSVIFESFIDLFLKKIPKLLSSVDYPDYLLQLTLQEKINVIAEQKLHNKKEIKNED